MSDEPSSRADLYKGTAKYYDQFRPPCPSALVEDLRRRMPISGGGRLLDLACGTGQVTFALAGDFSDVVAVDQEVESVACGREKAQRLGLTHVQWLVGRAEDVSIAGGPFELVAIGNAFQRLQRQVVAEQVMSWLAPGGCLALLWGGTPWEGQQSWQRAMAHSFEVWMHKVGALDRVPPGWKEAMDRAPHSHVLEQAGLSFEGHFEFPTQLDWTVETLVGFVYSTSFLNPTALGRQLEEFEQDLRARLAACEPWGEFHQDTSFAYELARRTPD